jgi:hypothetical protein
MAVNPFTNDFMRALPAALRPNPYTVDEHVMEAVAKGWDTDTLAKACYVNDRKPNPAFVVTNLRNLCQHPPKQMFTRTGWDYGHIPCDRHEDCEICRCIPNQLIHHHSIKATDD